MLEFVRFLLGAPLRRQGLPDRVRAFRASSTTAL